MPTATETETVRFESKTSDLALTRRPVRYGDDGYGGRIAITQEEFRARKEEKGEELTDELPWKVIFENGSLETDNPELIAWLRGHKRYGTNEPSGFFEVKPSAEDLKPTVSEQMRAIGRAEAIVDPLDSANALIEIRDAERDTHNRPAVIQASEEAMRVIAEEPPESGADAGSGDGDPKSTSTPSQPA